MVAVVVVVVVGAVVWVVRLRHHCETVIKMLGRMVVGLMKLSVLLMMWLRSVYLSGGQILKARAQVGLLEKSWTWGWVGLFVSAVVVAFVVTMWMGH